MTKKKVRIYKAPDGKGQYINKTAKFLNKAAFGGESGTPQDDMYNQLSQAAYMSIKKGQSPKAVYDSLLNSKISKDIAEKIVASVVQFMLAKGELEPEELEQEQQKEQQLQEQQAAQQEKQKMAAEADAANEAQMDAYNEQSMGIANDMSQYDEEAEANLDTEDLLGFEGGGQMTTDDLLGELNKHQNDINFQDLESLIQSTPGTQSASYPGLENYYLPYIPLYSESNEIPMYNPISNDEYKFGGKTKKKFAREVLKLLKKAEGGEDEAINNTIATPTDDLTNTVKRKKDSFINAVSDEAKQVKIQEYYDQIKNSNDPDTQEILGNGPNQMNAPIRQFGGTAIYDPVASGLAKYVYGGNDFPEDSKNVNDPYFSDMTPYPQMQNGGDPTEFTHYTHGQDDIFHDQMTGLVQAEDGLETGDDQYALDYIRQLAGQMKGYNKATRQLGRQYRRATGNTLLDYLIPINRSFNPGYNIQQKGMPFVYGSNEAYEGNIDPSRFVARDVYKTGRYGPKKFIDYYSVGNEGLNVPDDLSEIQPYGKQTRSQKQDQSKPASGDRLDRRIERWDRRAARNEEEYQPMEGAITNYENPEDFYNAINPVSDEDAEFLGAGFTPSSQYVNKGKVKKVRDAEGNWYDRNEEIIPGKKSPSEVPGYYDKKQDGGEPNQEDYYNDLFSKLNYSNNYSNYYNELAYKRGGRVLRKAAFGLDNTPVAFGDNSVMQNTPDPMEQMTAFQQPIIEDSEFNFPTDLPGPAPITDAYVEPAENDWSGPQMSNEAIDYPAGPEKLKNKLVGVKRKRKSRFDGEAYVNAFNVGAKGGLGGIDRINNRKQEAQMYVENFDPTKLYGKKERMDKGDWDVNTGIYRTNETGSNRLGRSKKYGGYMQPGGPVDQQMYYPEDNMVYPPGDSQYPMIPLNQDIMDMLYNKYYSNPNFVPYTEDPYIEEAPQQVDYRMVKEGGETYMSDEQINAFLAEGGEIEYL